MIYLAVTTIVFGLPQGQWSSQVDLCLPAPTLSLRDLIAYKIAREVAEVEAGQRPGLSGEHLSPETLISATAPGALLPGTVEDEIERAQQAFALRAYMIVMDDRRLLDPEAQLTVSPSSCIEFIKILPLVGG